MAFSHYKFQTGDVINTTYKKYILDVRPSSNKNSSARLNGTIIVIHLSVFTSPSLFRRITRDLVRRVISADQISYLKNLVFELNQKYFNVEVKSIKIKNAKTRWGSASQKGGININFKLLLAPREILEYVIVHELAHIIEFNHSKRYWGLVRRACPDYKQRIRWLKENGKKL